MAARWALSIALTAVVFAIAVVIGGYRQFCLLQEAKWGNRDFSPGLWRHFWCRKLVWILVSGFSLEAALSVGYIAGTLWNSSQYLNGAYGYAFLMTLFFRWFLSVRLVAKPMLEKREPVDAERYVELLLQPAAEAPDSTAHHNSWRDWFSVRVEGAHLKKAPIVLVLCVSALGVFIYAERRLDLEKQRLAFEQQRYRDEQAAKAEAARKEEENKRQQGMNWYLCRSGATAEYDQDFKLWGEPDPQKRGVRHGPANQLEEMKEPLAKRV